MPHVFTCVDNLSQRRKWSKLWSRALPSPKSGGLQARSSPQQPASVPQTEPHRHGARARSPGGPTARALSYDAVLAKLDDDGDGRISTREVEKAEAAGMTWLSDTLHARYVLFGDADRDGVVDRTEYEELMVAHSRSFHGEL